MSVKVLPMSSEAILEASKQFATPFYLYDEASMLENAQALYKAFQWAPNFKNYFAVKATPTPKVIAPLYKMGMGLDCSSYAELLIAEKMGIQGEDIMFTSNNTPEKEMKKAKELGAIINLDDISHIEFLQGVGDGMPSLVCMRYNPGNLKEGNVIIGNPEDAKYGFTYNQILDGMKQVKDLGVTRFGLHTMVASNELNEEYFVETAELLFNLVKDIYTTHNIRVEFVNLGGGIGIPYTPEQKAVDYNVVSQGIEKKYNDIIVTSGLDPLHIKMENGRVITGPYGVLVSKVIHKKHTYKEYVGIDATMADLMRPGIYGAYHHITVLGKEHATMSNTYDVTGSLCENNDKFAIDRTLPAIEIGDILVIHDAGAHGHAMGFNYNGKLRCAEVVLKQDRSYVLARNAQTYEQYLQNIIW